MKNGRYFFFFLVLLVVEIVVSFFLFTFAVQLRNEYVIFSIAIIFFIVAYLFYGRFREKIKVEEKKNVLKRYSRNFFVSLLVITLIVVFSIIAFGVYLLIRSFSV